MEKLTMHSVDGVTQNVERIAALFPNCVTERKGENGEVERAIDFDLLRQELSRDIIDTGEERYQFTWPGKREAIRLANAPTNCTLRPVRDDSVDFDTTQNLYIEGDNLEVLKLLRETYLGKVKMIYIDPPYNTGNDFVYEDDFSESYVDYKGKSGMFDENGNMLLDNYERNNESNGRFHTDWLNLMYPRLKVARDLLAEDGVIFISIDDNEVENLKKVCNEIFGANNFVAIINWKGRGGRQDSKYYAMIHEYIVVFAKNINFFVAGEEIKQGDVYPKFDEQKQRYYKTQLLRKWGSNSLREDRPNLYYPITAPDGTEVYPTIYSESRNSDLEFQEIQGRWRHGASNLAQMIADGRVEFQHNKWGKWVPYEKIFAPKEGEEKTKKYTTWVDDISNGTEVLKTLFGGKAIFDYSKSPSLLNLFIRMANVEDGIILDFFSGSATTAHAVMQLNAEDGGTRKFIMVQLPEVTDEKSEASKAGYANICEIGKERIRRAGKKIKSEAGLLAKDLDIGFRVLRLDSSNMEDVYYTPDKFDEANLFNMVDNVKTDRNEEDLLFQVMLELDVPLSASIKQEQFAGKNVFVVADGHLIATFDKDVNESTVTEIARRKPNFFVMRDASAANDNVLDNFEQIFRHFSPDTICKIL